jgi:hypothetical protein
MFSAVLKRIVYVGSQGEAIGSSVRHGGGRRLYNQQFKKRKNIKKMT